MSSARRTFSYGMETPWHMDTANASMDRPTPINRISVKLIHASRKILSSITNETGFRNLSDRISSILYILNAGLRLYIMDDLRYTAFCEVELMKRMGKTLI